MLGERKVPESSKSISTPKSKSPRKGNMSKSPTCTANFEERTSARKVYLKSKIHAVVHCLTLRELIRFSTFRSFAADGCLRTFMPWAPYCTYE